MTTKNFIDMDEMMNTVETQGNISHVEFASLKLRAGAWMQLQSMDDAAKKFEVEFAAALHGKSIFVAMSDNPLAEIRIKAGERYLVRGFNGVSDFTFAATVLEIQIKPFVHAHLSYPVTVEAKVVREVLRVSASLPAAVMFHGAFRPITANVKDLSVAGALLESVVPIGAIGVSIEVRLSTRFETRETEMKIPAVIRHLSGPDASGLYKTGIEFGEVSRDDKLVLYYLLFTLGVEGR
jgi:hypothetical protein